MPKTWTDTHYQLEAQDWVYIARHDERGAVSLICPGYSRGGQGFSVHFTPAHIEILEHLLAALQSLKLEGSTATEGWAESLPSMPQQQPAMPV